MPPASPEPGQPAGDKQQTGKPIVVMWSEVAHYRAELPPEVIRRLFGLGGTPDAALPSRVVMIARHAPNDLGLLIDDSEYLGSSAYNLDSLDGVKQGDL